jgi:penicillin amidase
LNGLALTARESDALAVLSPWDFRYEENSSGAPLAYAWFKQTESGLWSRLFPDRKGYWYPPVPKTIEVLQDPNSRWFDNPGTEKIETRAEIVRAALDRAIDEVVRKTGRRTPSKWTWAAFRPTTLAHVSHLPGVGHDDLPAAGMEHAIFANTGNHGPVWKMVVALGSKGPRAYGVYPGGQSGDPFSPHFEDFVTAWRRGEMKELQYLLSPTDADTRKLGHYTLEAQP